MLRLVTYQPEGARRFALLGAEQVVGSSDRCDIRLTLPGVAANHAVLRRRGRDIEIEALDAQAPVFVNGARSKRATLEVLDEVRLGAAVMVLEDAGSAPFTEPKARTGQNPDLAASLSRPPLAAGDAGSLLEWLSRLSDWVVSDSESRTSLESLLKELLADFGGGSLFLFEGRLERADLAVRLAVATDDRWLTSAQLLLDSLARHARPTRGRTIGYFADKLLDQEVGISFRFLSALDRDYFMVCALQDSVPGDWSPELGLASVADLLVLGLVHHVGRYEPILPGRSRRRDLVVSRELVLGPSPATQKMLETLRALVNTDGHLVLVGEPGTRREAIALTLHQSSSRSKGPFVVCRCDGASSEHLEADLFGAQVAGKSGPVRREGKLQLAHRGTLYLEGVERLPLETQGRLVRLLRSGWFEGPADGERSEARPRVISASDTALADLLAAGSLRIDLAFLLAQVSVEVPALRDRREDLPLIVQTCVNRYSHESGKRVRGITVAALSALASYSFPGNLAELDNAVRQMVYLAADGAPLDVELLPPEIRSSSVSAERRIDGRTDVLDLRQLVAGVEQAAIREALRRSGGNKSRAARLLGISRNGLAQKMKRHSA